ncbi:hypothetical protein [Janthinobacterium sp. B9-8]|uniref:hypothetical protein n=1 Tax=Janthinobacterium sp. B9-8 TaxID=1236179 RepID=UPI00061D26EE|nr:hypothetical protein [Janthinobacterium sp. B9-8]AMC35531.1 hypothetical protein VN23_13355 [Janthinobacterium sp. B9-8]
MEILKEFSNNYANALGSLMTLGIFILAAVTLWFLRREYSNKYRPYVVPEVRVEPLLEGQGYAVTVIPRNVGPHLCEVMLSEIRLHIGDETYETPNFKEWVLVAPQVMEVRIPVGHVNQLGIQKVREARYKINRIEVSFSLTTRATDKRFIVTKLFSYDIGVQGETPVVQFRPEWHKSA